MNKEVAIIGAGWYGVHTALQLRKNGHPVTLFEKSDVIFGGISGNFGIRLHAGPHYPRSPVTRESCRMGFEEFLTTYPELVLEHERSIYGLGKVDSDGKPSKVGYAIFKDVCEEFMFRGEVTSTVDDMVDLTHLKSAFDVYEPSVVLGTKLRRFFSHQLSISSVRVQLNTEVEYVERDEKKIVLVVSDGSKFAFDEVINCTGYKSMASEKIVLPFGAKPVFQPCLGILVEDKMPRAKPSSMIIMDGWFPCLMPYDDNIDDKQVVHKHIMIHGKHTIMASYDSVLEAQLALKQVDDRFVFEKVAKPTMEHMAMFWKNFLGRFHYLGWEGTVLPKVRCGGEFRSAFVFRAQSGVIFVFPGKINNIFDSAREVELLMVGKSDQIMKDHKSGCQIVKSGMFDVAREELQLQKEDERSTSRLQSFKNYLDEQMKEKNKQYEG